MSEKEDIPVEKLENPVKKVEDSVEKLETPIAKVVDSVEKLETPIEKVEDSVEKLETTIDKIYKIEDSIEKLEIPIEKVEDSVEKLEAVVKKEILVEKLDRPVEKVEILVEKLDTPVENVEILVEKLNTQVENVEILVEKPETPVSNLETSVEKLESAAENQKTPTNIKTKQNFREKVWCQMAEKRLTNSFRTLGNRIPYFKGTTEATKRLAELEAFKESKMLMISPDKFLILLSLKKEKEILIPTPRLLTGLFLHIKNAAGLPEEEAKEAITRNSMKQIERPVGFDTTDLKVDMVILGSVCVNRAGYRIGDGEGFSDLEYAILSKMKAVDESTLIVTMVHDCQILDDLPNELFQPHDVPVDIIITPTQTIFVNPKLPKPKEIIWSAISKRRLAAISVLNDIKKFEEKEGKVLTLKDEDSDEESHFQEKIRVKKMVMALQNKYRHRKSRPDSGIKENGIENGKEVRRKPYYKKRRFHKSKENRDDAENKPTENQSNVKSTRSTRHRFGNHVDFSLRLSNIASTVRVRDLKNALLDRGVKPSSITWRGQKGYCYLNFGKLRKKTSSSEQQQPVQVDSIVANLQQLKIGEEPQVGENGFIVVEPAEPITRIEVTDVSAV